MDNFKHDFSLHEDNQLANSQVFCSFYYGFIESLFRFYPILITLIAW